MEFRPTKTWVKEHKEHPESCSLKECHCLLNDWVEDYGICVGIQPDNKDAPDIVAFCCSYYSPEDNKPVGHKFLFHPQEANWISAALALASVEAWGLIPEYRKLMAKLKRKRGIGSHKTGRVEK